MTNLDINTPAGRATVEHELLAIARFHKGFPAYQYCHTPKDQAAVNDGVVIKRPDNVTAIVETKCRQMDHGTFTNQFNSAWLVTASKLFRAQQLAEAMCVDLWGFLYLVPDDMLLIKTLWRPTRGWVVGFGVRRTETAATVNGGSTIRANAYIDMANCTVL